MTTRWAGLGTGLMAVALLAGACTSSSPSPTASPTAPVPASPETPSPVPTGPGSAAAAMAALCRRPPGAPSEEVKAEGPTPPAIATVERQVEEVRGLDFVQRVAVDAVTHARLVKRIDESFDHSYPVGMLARRTRVWQTIGAIPAGIGIRDALQRFVSGQVIGFYVPANGELVFIGTDRPTPLERVTLAHELTHAVDDQHFGLERIDRLENRCREEPLAAAVATVEGSAQFFSIDWARRFLTLEEQLGLAGEQAPSLAGIPPFIVRTQAWPYAAGLSFISALATEGGPEAVNGAIRDFPVSTEQIINPERYPNDVPQPVDVPDLGPKLGEGWTDLDVQEVGEEWLSILLGLRLDGDVAESAAAGWDGGLYRAWSDGDHVAVVLSTVWDTSRDASEFAGAMQEWLDAGAGQQATVLPPSGNRVGVLFASDAGTFSVLRTAT